MSKTLIRTDYLQLLSLFSVRYDGNRRRSELLIKIDNCCFDRNCLLIVNLLLFYNILNLLFLFICQKKISDIYRIRYIRHLNFPIFYIRLITKHNHIKCIGPISQWLTLMVRMRNVVGSVPYWGNSSFIFFLLQDFFFFVKPSVL